MKMLIAPLLIITLFKVASCNPIDLASLPPLPDEDTINAIQKLQPIDVANLPTNFVPSDTEISLGDTILQTLADLLLTLEDQRSSTQEQLGKDSLTPEDLLTLQHMIAKNAFQIELLSKSANLISNVDTVLKAQ